MTQQAQNVLVKRVLDIISTIEKEVIPLDAEMYLEVMTDIMLSICHEFGRIPKDLADEELADVLEFLEHYELPYKLQKKFGLMESGITVLEVAKQQSAFLAKWYGLKK